MRPITPTLLIALFPAALAAQSSQTLTVEGVSRYDSAELLSFAGQLAGQRHGVVTPGLVADIIETIYLEDGYFLAEAWVSADSRSIFVDEGEIGSVVIEGVDSGTFALIKGLVDPVVGVRGVQQDAFERAIMLVEDIESLTALAEVDYPAGSDTANLRIIATPVDTSFSAVTLDNPPRSLGDTATLSFIQQNLSLLTPGDLARAELSYSNAFDGGESDLFGALTYRLPVGTSGAYAEFYGANVTASRDATGTLQATDISGLTTIAALGYPAIRSVDSFGYGLVEYRRSESNIDVGNASFDSAVDAFGASWIYSRALSQGGVIEYGINVTLGDNTDGAAIGDGDAQFRHLRFGLGYDAPVSGLGDGASVRAEIYGQYTDDALPSVERFLLGSRDKERGYALAEASGDSGISASLEVGRDILFDTGMVQLVRPYAFYDAGAVSLNAPTAGQPDEVRLASAGFGVDLVLNEGLGASAYVGVPLRDGPTTEKHDPAVYLALTKEW